MPDFRRAGAGRDSKIVRRKALNYYRAGAKPTKSPFKKNPKSKNRGFLSRVLDWLVIIIVLGGLGYSLLLQPQPKLIVNSTAYRPAGAYREAVAAKLQNLKNRNKLSFDEAALEQSLKQQFPEINTVSVNLPLFGHIPVANIVVSQPSLLLKGAEGAPGAGERLVVDAKGTVIGPAANFPAVKDLPLITDESDLKTGVGQIMLSLSEVGFIRSLVEQAQKAGVPIASLSLPKQAQELDLRTTDRSYYVKFYLGGDVLAQTGQFLAARQRFDQTAQQPQHYLDARVAGKVYYK